MFKKITFNKKLITLSVAAALVVGCDSSTTNTQSTQTVTTETVAVEQVQQQSLKSWLDNAYEERIQQSPMQLAFLGRKDKYDQFDDNSDEAIEKGFALYASQIEQMKAQFDYSELTLRDQLAFDYYIYLYEAEKRAHTFADQQYVFEQMNGSHSGYPAMVMGYHQIETLKDAQDFAGRMRGMAKALQNNLVRAKARAENGVRPPQFAYESVIKESKAIITGAPFQESEENAPLLNYAKTALDKLLDAGTITDEQYGATMQSIKAALVEEVGPVYADIVEFMTADEPNAERTATSTGVINLPKAKEFYAERLKYYTTTDMTAKQAHELGLSEVARLTDEMLALKDKVGFEGSLQEFFNFIQTDEQFFYPNTDEGRQGYIDDSTKYINDLLKVAPQFFNTIPKSEIVVKRVEAYREQPGAAQHYYPGFADGSKPGTYYAHLIDMKSMPKSEMEAIAYHEAVPGHHFDWAVTAEDPDTPLFISSQYISFYGEGWALYTELLAKEMGAYQNPYNDFGRLMTEMWRAVRLVVDTGLHHYGWTEEQAIKYMLDNNPIAPGAARSEIHRYQVMPGQATSYKVGMLKILELREKAKSELGDKFDIREFHDAILVGGSLPNDLLERRVNAWIESTK